MYCFRGCVLNLQAYFREAFSAYMFFLAGEHDKFVIDWLVAKNALELDSLIIDSDIAFAIFAQRITIKLRIDALYKRTPKMLGTVDLADVADKWKVSRLVKSGTLGMAVDGDEIAAVTYATDAIAKQFGVLDKLPCVVVFDAIPSKRMEVIRLTEGSLENFIPLLRTAIAKYHASKGHEKSRALLT